MNTDEATLGKQDILLLLLKVTHCLADIIAIVVFTALMKPTFNNEE